MRFNGYNVLQKILDNPVVFPHGNNIDQIARDVVLAHMKAASSVEDIAAIYAVLGPDNFKMVSDGISDKDTKSILGKVDKQNKEAKTTDGATQRVLLIELASGKVEPRAKIVKEYVVQSIRRTPKSGAGKAIKATSTKATRKSP